MPIPHGRDRVLETGDGALVLSCFRPKGWSGRPGAGGPGSTPTESAVAAAGGRVVAKIWKQLADEGWFQTEQ